MKRTLGRRSAWVRRAG